MMVLFKPNSIFRPFYAKFLSFLKTQGSCCVAIEKNVHIERKGRGEGEEASCRAGFS
jgi:hypothetical protein